MENNTNFIILGIHKYTFKSGLTSISKPYIYNVPVSNPVGWRGGANWQKFKTKYRFTATADCIKIFGKLTFELLIEITNKFRMRMT